MTHLAPQDSDRVLSFLERAVVPALNGGGAEVGRLSRRRVTPFADSLASSERSAPFSCGAAKSWPMTKKRSLRVGDDVTRCRAIATEMVASGLGATTNPASRPFSAVHPGQIDEILDLAYSRAEAVLQAVTRHAMHTAANPLSSLGVVTGAALRTLMAGLTHSTESHQDPARQVGDGRISVLRDRNRE